MDVMMIEAEVVAMILMILLATPAVIETVDDHESRDETARHPKIATPTTHATNETDDEDRDLPHETMRRPQQPPEVSQ